jgi:predicted  nucleic acid-binding Zn-ribbon protein
MVNKNKLSAQISAARSKLLGNLIDKERLEDVGYEKHLFPPDKTVYLSLLKQNGFHQQIGGEWQLKDPTSTSFQSIWQAFENFLASSKQAKRTLKDFVDEVSVSPFKIKKGLLDFLLPLFLLIKRDSYALYYEGTRFIPQLTGDTIELIIRKPEQYSVKAFHVEGVRLEVFNYYRDLLSQAATTELSKKGFIDTIVPFLTFYKDLPAYAKQTKTITKDSQRLRDAITKATDPEKSFFEDFPQALGYSLVELNDSTEKLEVYFEELRRSIKEIQTSYEALLERFENYIRKDLLGLKDGGAFEEWRAQLQKRFAKAKKDLLPPQLKTFLMRLNSPLDDKNAWLNSIAQVINSKSLDNIQDFEEDTLYRKLKEAVEELDNYTDIIKNSSDDELLETFKVQLTNIQSGSQSRIVKINQQNLKDVSKRQEKLTKELTDDKNLNIFILARLLEEELKK